MFIRDESECSEIIAGDGTRLKELLNPLKDDIQVRYSLAIARIKPGESSIPHRLKTSEVYYILSGEGEMTIGDEHHKVVRGQAIYIPPNAEQKIKNIGPDELAFICIVDPAWREEDEEILSG
jgi:mannose-6-phosphate isomerase-like protein (cupin superfamily)